MSFHKKDLRIKYLRQKAANILYFQSASFSYYEKIGSEIVCIDNELPFNLPNGWSWCRLSELFVVCSAKRVLQSERKKEGVPFYRAREIVKLSTSGCVDNELFISNEHYEFLKTTFGVPQHGDLMITGAGTIGKTYVVQKNDIFYYKDASVLCLKNRNGAINPEYAKIMMDSNLLQEQIRSKTYGNTVDTITITTANNYLCVLPPFEDQVQIVKAINEIGKTIETIEQSLS